MRSKCLKILDSSGQSLVIFTMIGLVLAIGVTVVIFLSESGTKTIVRSDKRTTARGSAETGIAETIHLLSASSTTWANALANNFSNTECNTGNFADTPSGERFKIYCEVANTSNPRLQNYQVAITAVAYDQTGSNAIRSVRAYVSKRTLGVDLATDVHAAAALQLIRAPSIAGTLNVHWGPIVCLEAGIGTPSIWTLPQPIEGGRYPRKFSQGGLTGTTYPRSGATLGSGTNTDQREYFAFVNQTFVPLVDETTYKNLAAATMIVNPPKSRINNANNTPVDAVCGVNPCGFFKPAPADAALFDGSYTVPSGAVIFVDGDAEFKRVAIDDATFIITGKLTISDDTDGAGRMLHVPITAPIEYPYEIATSTSWPCSVKSGNRNVNQPAYDCDSDDVFNGNVHFRGFLYVKGNLQVDVANWNMVGALMVGNAEDASGGQLVIPTGKSLNLAYDDYINHSIFMSSSIQNSIKVIPDLVEDIPNP